MSQLQLHTYFFNCTLHFLLLKNQQLMLIKNNINYYTVHIVMMHCIFKKYYTINNNYQIIYGFTQHYFAVNQFTFALNDPNVYLQHILYFTYLFITGSKLTPRSLFCSECRVQQPLLLAIASVLIIQPSLP